MDRSNYRIQIFDQNGEYLEEWPLRPGPNKAVIDDDHIMHVAGGEKGIQIMTLGGAVVGQWGERGSEPWQFSGGPYGLCIDSHGDVYVAQVGAENALNKFARV